MPTYESLLERIRQSPYDHLGRQSVSEIHPYILGYDWARTVWGLPRVSRTLAWERFKKWLDSKVHLCRQGLPTFCLLLAEDERQAFELFFEFHDASLEECKEYLVSQNDVEAENFRQERANKSETLIQFILRDDGIKKRPAMYLGNKRCLSGLWAFCSGFLWAERDLGITNSSDAMNMELFQMWLDDRFPIAKGQTWDKLFYFNALGSETWAMEQFYENFEMFLAGKATDAPPKWVEIAVETIKKRAENEN